MNLAAIEDMNRKFPHAELCFVESGGDNLAAKLYAARLRLFGAKILDRDAHEATRMQSFIPWHPSNRPL